MSGCGSSTSLLHLDSRLRPWATALVASARNLDPGAKVTSTYRTRATQECLLRAAASGAPGVYKPAKHSQHERGLAFDIAASPAALTALHSIWAGWGGAPAVAGDPVHFQPMIQAGGLTAERSYGG
jgi:hypothetical protein